MGPVVGLALCGNLPVNGEPSCFGVENKNLHSVVEHTILGL